MTVTSLCQLPDEVIAKTSWILFTNASDAIAIVKNNILRYVHLWPTTSSSKTAKYVLGLVLLILLVHLTLKFILF
jgi:hypothetical protein